MKTQYRNARLLLALAFAACGEAQAQNGAGQYGTGSGTGGGTTLPVVDTTAIVKGSGDATKLVRIEADGITTGTTRVITMPDSNVDLGGLTASNLASSAVSTAKIAANAVDGTKIALGSDAAGDVMYYNGTDYVRLAIGGANTVLHGGSSAPAYSAIATGDIASSAITSALIADGTITDSDVAAANKDGASATASLRTLGSGAAQACAGNDSRLSDTRTPTDNTVTSAKIVDATIVDADLATTILRRLGFYRARLCTAAALATNTRTGDVLTASGNGALTIDGVSAAANNVVVVNNEVTGANDGLYTVTSAGSGGSAWSLTRIAGADSTSGITSGITVFVSEGTANAGARFALTTLDPITVNTTALTFSAAIAMPSGVQIDGYDVGSQLATLVAAMNQVTIQNDAAPLTVGTAVDFIKLLPVNSISPGIPILCTYESGNTRGDCAVAPSSHFAHFEDDFFGFQASGADVWNNGASGTGAAIGLQNGSSTANHPGILGFTLGTATNGRVFIQTGANTFRVDATAAPSLHLAVIFSVSAISDGTDRYNLQLGLGNASGAGAFTDGAYIEYQDNLNSGGPRCCVCASSTCSCSTGGAALSTSFIRMELVITGSSMQCYRDNAAVGSAVTTNFPSSATGLALVLEGEKSLGTTSRQINIDKVSIDQGLTR